MSPVVQTRGFVRRPFATGCESSRLADSGASLWPDWALVLALGLAFVLAGCAEPLKQPVAVGEPLPAFELPRLDGGSLQSAELAGDGPVILNFWATWCRPCVKEIPVLRDLHQAGVRVVSISIDGGDDGEIRDFARDHGIEYEILRGSVSTVVRYGSSSIPYTLVLDRDLNVRFLHRAVVSAATLERDLSAAR